MLARRNVLVGQINSFLCNFSKVDVSVKNTLFRVYCSSNYGSELWDLTNRRIEDYCVAWRKGLCKLWKLPYEVWILPLFRTLYRTMMSFAVELWTFYTLVYIAIQILFNQLFSTVFLMGWTLIGRKVAHCSAHFNLSIGCIGVSKLRSHECLDIC